MRRSELPNRRNRNIDGRRGAGSDGPKYVTEYRGGIRCTSRADKPKVTYRGGIACYGFDDDADDSLATKAKNAVKKFLGG